jgi:lysozyme
MSTIAREWGGTLVRQFEGFRSHPYRDNGKGIWTIGYGSIRLADGSPVTADTLPVTIDEAEALMQAELQPTCDEVDLLIPASAADNQRAAAYSFAYNEGVGALAGSTLLRLWLAGDVVGASAEFPKWNIAGGRIDPGLVNRRRMERAVFDGLVTP